MKEQNFLNNSFFKEGKFGFNIDLDPQDLKNLKIRNGKYRIEAKRPKNNPEKWYLAENTWEPKPGAQPASSRVTPPEQTNDLWAKAKGWQEQQPDNDLPDFLR